MVRVYDVGEVEGTPYFVMSYADQGTVADLLAPRDLGLARPHPRPGLPGGRRALGAARAGRDPPRHQAGQPAAAQRRDRASADGRRPRGGEGDAARQRPDPRGRHPGVHGSRAGDRWRRRRARRRLRPGGGDLPPAHADGSPTRARSSGLASLRAAAAAVGDRRRAARGRRRRPARTRARPRGPLAGRPRRSSTPCRRSRAGRTLLVSPAERPRNAGTIDDAEADDAPDRVTAAARAGLPRRLPGLLRRRARRSPRQLPADHRRGRRFPRAARSRTTLHVGSHHPSRPAHPATHPAWRERKRPTDMSADPSVPVPVPAPGSVDPVDVFELGPEHEQVVFCNDRGDRAQGHRRDPLHGPRSRARRHPLLPLRLDRRRGARRPEPLPRHVLQGRPRRVSTSAAARR